MLTRFFLPAAGVLFIAPVIVAQDAPDETIKALVGRLQLQRYKETIRGLTRFGDRRQGTDRNRAALDWIEAQLKSYGCAPAERIHYNYAPPAQNGRAGRGGDQRRARAGGRQQRSQSSAGPAPARVECAAFNTRPARGSFLHED